MVKDDTSNVDGLIGLLLHEEARLEQEHNRWLVVPSPVHNASIPIALNVHRTPPRHQASGSTSASTHSPGSRYTDPNPKRRRPHCQLCNKPGHEAVDCWQRSNLVDYPSCKPNPRAPQSHQAHFAQQFSPSKTIYPNWYIDTGAIDHIQPDLQNMTNVEDYQGTKNFKLGTVNNFLFRILAHLLCTNFVFLLFLMFHKSPNISLVFLN